MQAQTLKPFSRFALVLTATAAILASLPPATVADATDPPPNIIFFLSDDHRADLLGCAGHPILKTPTIDRLASEGVRFENAFVTTSICAASRATIFTGLWERSHKFTFGTPPIANEFIDESYPALLREAGYRTGFVGKFGVGVPQGAKERMFDYFTPLNRNPYFKREPDGSLRHLTEIVGDRGIEFLRACRKGQPFCLSISFNAAHAEDSDKLNHYPWPKAEDGLYDDATIPPPLVSTDFWEQLPEFLQDCMHRDRWFWRWDTPEKYQKNVKAYYRMITGLDRVMGRILDEADRLGFGENTVVIFIGDNGYYKGSRGFAGKWSHFEESLRVPLVVFDPRVPKEKRGRVLDNMALNVDVPATMMAAACGSVPASHQGQDLMPLVHGKQPENWRDDFLCEHLFDNARIPKFEGVRGQQYVYARYFEHMPEGEFLHDLEKDPKQIKNLVGDPDYADALTNMRNRCDELRDCYGGEYSLEKFPTVRSKRKKTKPTRPKR